MVEIVFHSTKYNPISTVIPTPNTNTPHRNWAKAIAGSELEDGSIAG